MLQTLPLVLFIVMAEVSIGAVSVLVFLDWRNEVKRGFLVSYALIYLVLAGLTYWFQQGFSTPELLNTYPQLDKAWTGYQSLPLLLFFLLLIPYSFFLLIDKTAGVQNVPEVASEAVGAEGDDLPSDADAIAAVVYEETAMSEDLSDTAKIEPEVAPTQNKTIRNLRLLSGAATVVAGFITLFVMAMIYRPLSAGSLDGFFTVAGFFAAAFALGGVLTAMWLGHWYLVTPALSGRPLQFSTTLVLVAIVAQVLFFIVGGSTSTYANQTNASTPVSVTQATPAANNEVKPADAPVVAPLSSNVISWIRVLVGFAMPLILGALAWKLIRDRSFQSATGMLYLVVVCTLAGEIMSRGLFVGGLL
jgi:DMSO reductase anchor subunit